MRLCKHFQECGGCSSQDISYKEQLRHKEEKVRELMGVYGIAAELKPINFYDEWFYRNKMEFTFAADKEVVCGMNSKVTPRRVFNVEECLLFSPDTGKIVKTAKDFTNRKNYPAYNKFFHKGFLRYLIVRQSKFTNETMIGIVTTSIQQLDKEEFLEDLMSLSLDYPIKSVYWIINDSLSDAVVFEKKELIYGSPFIREKLDGLSFNIGVDSFFQINSSGIRDLYEKIRNYAGLSKEESVLDLFCGAGAIGLFLARAAKFVWGVELKKEIVEAAWENAKLNRIENISFFALDVRKFLNTQGQFYKDIDTLIINPPRCGLSKKILRAIVRLNPKKIMYSSCNPDSLFRDIKELSAYYKADFIEPFDFFPHTPHIECLSVLRKNF